MKGNLHTYAFMHALLDTSTGLRLPGRRVSHLFLVDIPAYPKLLAITDAAINIAPDLSAKADILRNAVAFLHDLGVEMPKVAVLSALETVSPAIASTLDAACLSLMGRRGRRYRSRNSHRAGTLDCRRLLRSLVISPKLESIGVLAGVVPLRKFLNFSLQVEIDANWPRPRSVLSTSKKPGHD